MTIKDPLFTPADVDDLRSIAQAISPEFADREGRLWSVADRLQLWLDQQHDPKAGRPLMVFNDATGLWDRARQQDLDVGKMPVEIP